MRLRSTHLGDHDGSELVKKAPGRGTVPFEALLREVYQSGYDGSLDIEFVCEPSAVENQYKQGLEYLKGILKSL